MPSVVGAKSRMIAPAPAAAPAGAGHLAAGFTLTSLGGGMHEARSGAATHLLDDAEREALLSCDRTRTLDEHARAQPTAARARAVAALAARGLLVTAAELLQRVQALAGGEAPPPPIERLVVFSCVRPALACAAVEDHLAAARGAERPLRVMLIDDARDPEATKLVRRELAASSEVRIVDRAERAALADELARSTSVDASLVRAALLGFADAGSSGGAARTSALLAHSGSLFAATDDDARARSAAPRGARRAALVVSRLADPTLVDPYPSRAAALAATEPDDRPAFAWFDAVLGRRCAALVAEHDSRVELDVAVHRLLEAPEDSPGRVRLAALGIAGDAGASHPAYPLLARARDRARLRREWRGFRYSREQVRAAPALTLSASPFFMSGFAGYDARALLPPFLPSGRASDATFAALLRRVAPADLVAHLPRVHLHDPPEERTHADPLAVLACPSANELLPLVLARLPARGARADERLVELGLGLERFASEARFAASVEERIRVLLDGRAARLAEVLDGLDGVEAAAFARDVEDARRRVQETLSRPAIAPRDPEPGGLEVVAERWRRFGELLAVWPRLWRAAGAQLAAL